MSTWTGVGIGYWGWFVRFFRSDFFWILTLNGPLHTVAVPGQFIWIVGR